MKRSAGIFLIILGSALIFSALGLFLYNFQEQQEAGESSALVMPEIVEVMQERTEDPTAIEETAAYVEDRRMAVETIGGFDYVGFITIPSLELELPLMSTWSKRKLEIAPCRYWGDMYTNDLVIMAHNYPTHFRRIGDLRPGNTVTITDMDAVTYHYEVVAVDILDPYATEEMVAGEYDLTLFTCTYDGKNRVTVRCDRMNDQN